jgi:CDP-4-dehydro-6-deoxyglucose reductase, E3
MYMSAQVKMMPSGHEFRVCANESILEAGLRGGYALDYGCSNGNCGRCAVRVESGETELIRHHDFALSAAAKAQGMILSCCHTARSELVIEAEEANGAGDIPVQETSLRLRKIDRSRNDVLIVNARTPRTRRLRFLAGQSVQLAVAGVGARTYPIASCPCDDMNLQFHVPLDESDPIALWLRQAKYNDSVELTGPFGDFVLNEGSPNPLFFVASGAGFGPVKALVEHAMALDQAPAIILLWQAASASHYMHNLPRSWHDAIDEFHYIRCCDLLTPQAIARAVRRHSAHAPGAMDIYAAVDAATRQALETYIASQRVAGGQVHWHERLIG